MEFLGRHCNHYTSSYCSASVTVCGKGLLLTANGGLLLQKPRERKNEEKRVREKERQELKQQLDDWNKLTAFPCIKEKKKNGRHWSICFFFRFVFFFFLIVVLGGTSSFHLFALSIICLLIYFSIYMVYNFVYL